MMQSPHLVDHLVDVAGYAACAADVLPDAPQPELPLDDAPVDAEPVVKSSPVAVEGLTGDLTYHEATNFYKVKLDNGGKRVFTYDAWHAAVRQGAAEYLTPEKS
jgi:hypothetical protein